MTEEEVDSSLRHFALQILAKNENLDDLILVGILKRGLYLANRVRNIIIVKSGEKIVPAVGSLNISFTKVTLQLLPSSRIYKPNFLQFLILRYLEGIGSEPHKAFKKIEWVLRTRTGPHSLNTLRPSGMLQSIPADSQLRS
jgi:hypothetical protein